MQHDHAFFDGLRIVERSLPGAARAIRHVVCHLTTKRQAWMSPPGAGLHTNNAPVPAAVSHSSTQGRAQRRVTAALDRLEQAEQAADKARQRVLKRPVKEVGGMA